MRAQIFDASSAEGKIYFGPNFKYMSLKINNYPESPTRILCKAVNPNVI